jgi:methylmalonyl-CoA/ethylmalonyl-CoA epimerase
MSPSIKRSFLRWLPLYFALGPGLEAAMAENEDSAPVLDHIAFVVQDIEHAARKFADALGVEEPAIVTTEALEQTEVCYLGNRTEASARLAFVQLENIVIELIEPVAGRSAWGDFLDGQGSGVHHITLRVDELDGHISDLEGKGGKRLQVGSFRGGEYAYMDMTEQLQVVLELLAPAPQHER